MKTAPEDTRSYARKKYCVFTNKLKEITIKIEKGWKKGKEPTGGNQEEAGKGSTFPSYGRRSSVPSTCGKQHMPRAQVLQRQNPLPRPRAGDESRHVDRQLKRSQCLFSLLRLLRHRLLHSNFLFEHLHLFVSSSCVPSVQWHFTLCCSPPGKCQRKVSCRAHASSSCIYWAWDSSSPVESLFSTKADFIVQWEW